MTRRVPLDRDLYAAVKAEAKAIFKRWPSARASQWLVNTYLARGGEYEGEPRSAYSGLTKWGAEKWVDLSRPIYDEDGTLIGYAPCGREVATSQTSTRDYPKCRHVDEAMSMTPDEVASAIRRKRTAEAKASPERGRKPVRVATYRRNPDVFTADEVIESARLADSQGKQAGHSMEAAYDLIRQSGDHVLVSIPLAYLHTHFDDEGYLPSAKEAARIEKYALMDTHPPPIRATFRGRRGSTRFFVQNGNHRVVAARLRGDTHIDAFVPKADYERFAALVGA